VIPLLAALSAEAATVAPPSMPPSMELEWSAPADCPDGESVRSDVMRLTGHESNPTHHLAAHVNIRRLDRSSWVLSMTTVFDGIAGERTLSAGSCESLAEAAMLTLALILNPNLYAVLPPTRVDEASPSKQASASPATDSPARPRWRLGVQAGIVAGVLAEASPSFALSVGVALGRLTLRLISRATWPQDVFLASEPKVGGRLWAVSVIGLGCWGARVGRLTPQACAGLDGTRIQGHGLGVLHPRNAHVYGNAAELAATIEYRPANRILFELGAVALVPLTRPGFYLDGIGQVSRPATLGIGGFGGLAWIFE